MSKVISIAPKNRTKVKPKNSSGKLVAPDDAEELGVVKPAGAPNSYLSCAIFVACCCNPILGGLAVISACMAEEANKAGDYVTGEKKGCHALLLIAIAIIITAIGIIAAIIWLTQIYQARETAERMAAADRLKVEQRAKLAKENANNQQTTAIPEQATPDNAPAASEAARTEVENVTAASNQSNSTDASPANPTTAVAKDDATTAERNDQTTKKKLLTTEQPTQPANGNAANGTFSDSANGTFSESANSTDPTTAPQNRMTTVQRSGTTAVAENEATTLLERQTNVDNADPN